MTHTVIDIETTGYLKYLDTFGRLDPSSQILSVGYINIDSESLNIIDAGVLYFYRPEFDVEAAQHVHHLTREFLSKYEKDFDENIAKLEALVTDRTLIGKNSNAFDLKFIIGFLKTWGNFNEMAGPLPESTVDMQEIFSPLYRKLYYQKYNVQLSGRVKGKLEEYVRLLDPNGVALAAVLKDIKKYTEINDCNPHDALYDAAMTYLVYGACVFRFRKEKSNGSV